MASQVKEDKRSIVSQGNFTKGQQLLSVIGPRNNPLAAALQEHAEMRPNLDAVIYPVNGGSYSSITYQQLNQEADRCAFGLTELGITKGTRVVFLVKPGRECMVILFALFKMGAVPVLVDPGMGVDRMLHCLKESEAEALIGIPVAHLLRTIKPKFFDTIKTSVTVGKKIFWNGAEYQQLLKRTWAPFPDQEMKGDDLAAIAFTTGSTGPAKGVEYSVDMVAGQLQSIKQGFGFQAEQISMPTFPLFSIFCIGLGMTTVIPDMDPTLPAKVDPKKIIYAINHFRVSSLFASPALLDRVGKYGKHSNLKLSSLKIVMAGGAPVRPGIIEDFSQLIEDDGEVYSAYGATEAIPISMIVGREILSETRAMTDQGFGTCVGMPMPGVTIRIIPASNEVISHFNQEQFLNPGSVGEIIVKGRMVSKHYYQNPMNDLKSKIFDGSHIWHRTGDVGWIDTRGRVWMCGRMKHMVKTKDQVLFTVPVESIFNTHPAINRTALVGVGEDKYQTPVLCIELKKNRAKRNNRTNIITDLQEIAEQHEITRSIEKFMFVDSFPVDIRHNAKIFREELAVKAQHRYGIK